MTNVKTYTEGQITQRDNNETMSGTFGVRHNVIVSGKTRTKTKIQQSGR